MRLLRQSTAFTFRAGPFVDSTDGFTAETALSIAQADIQISKDGAAFAQTSAASPTTTHDADGWYQCPLTSTDTNTLGTLTVQIVMSGALPVWEHFMVVPAVVFDALVDGTDNLDVSVTQFGGVNGTFSGGRPEVNATHWGGTAVASAYVRATLEQVLGTTITEGAAGRIAAAFQTYFNVASPVATAASVNQTGDSFARIGAPVGASISADVASVKTDTGNLVTRITSTLFSGITSLAQWLGAMAGKQTANSTARTEIRATGAGSGTFDETTDSLEGVRDNMGTAQTGDAYARIGTNGAGLTGIPWNANWDAEVQSEVADALDAAIPGTPTANSINERIQTMDNAYTAARASNLDNLDAAVSSRLAASSYTAPLDAAAIRAAVGMAAANLDTQLSGINAKTTNLPTDPADASDVAAAIGSAQSAITALLPSSLSGGRMRSDIEAINASTAAAVRQALAAATIITGTVDSTGFSPTTTEFEADDITEATADHYNGRVIIFTSGALIGQATSISDYAIASGRGHFTVPALTEAPANDVTFIIV